MSTTGTNCGADHFVHLRPVVPVLGTIRQEELRDADLNPQWCLLTRWDVTDDYGWRLDQSSRHGQRLGLQASTAQSNPRRGPTMCLMAQWSSQATRSDESFKIVNTEPRLHRF